MTTSVQPSSPLLSYEAALKMLLDARTPLSGTVDKIPLAEVAGRVLAKPVTAPCAMPGVDLTAMDGYAVRAADVAQAGVVLPVSQRIAAGDVGTPLAAGSAVRIFTGAPLPEGADSVVMQEDCTLLDDGSVRFGQAAQWGKSVRRRGSEVAQGSELLAVGTRLGPAHVALAASVGLGTLPVRPRLRVALFSSGNELLEVGAPPALGKIHDVNRVQLGMLLRELGCAVSDLGILPDDLDRTRQALTTAAADHDLLLTSGGVSVGEEDHIKEAVEASGTLELWKIAIKPGKPFAFGQVAGTDFIGLPGNPVSSFVTFVMLVQPFIRQRMGMANAAPPRRLLRAAFDWSTPDVRQEYLRARAQPDGSVVLHPQQGSAALAGLAWANGLVEIPPGQAIRAGDTVSFVPLDGTS